MTKEKLKDKIEEIQNRNYSKFKGSNEADLMIREEISDLFGLQNSALIERCKELEEYCKEVCEMIKSQEIIIQNNTDDDVAEWVYKQANNLLTKHK